MIEAERQNFTVRLMCRVLEISESGWYAWRRREPGARALANARLTEKIRTIMVESRSTYGAPRVTARLRQDGHAVSENRVARLMKAAGLRALYSKSFVRTTVRGGRAHGIQDLVRREFSVSGLDQLWLSDMTYLRTLDGFLYLAVVQDACSRRIVGWAMQKNQQASLMVRALKMALLNRSHAGVIHHSDQGSQYCSDEYQRVCESHGIEQSMGSIGDCYDNAQAESWFATLKRECVLRTGPLVSSKVLRHRVIEYIESWYNTRRIHTRLGFKTPVEFEAQLTQPKTMQPFSRENGCMHSMRVSTKSG